MLTGDETLHASEEAAAGADVSFATATPDVVVELPAKSVCDAVKVIEPSVIPLRLIVVV